MITNILKFWLGVAWLLGLAVAAALATVAAVFVHVFILASKIGEFAFSKRFTSKSTLNTLHNG